MNDYCNYHKHTDYSNIKVRDVITKIPDYLKRMVELEHTLYFTTEHGYQGNPFDTMNYIDEINSTLSDDKKIKMVMGAEAYFVKNAKDKDRGNYHLVLIALNNKGVEELNAVMTEANIDGMYYRPRVDYDMIERNLTPENFIVTSACVGGICAIWNEDAEEMVKWFKDYFGDNFYLEVQTHNEDVQKNHNRKILFFAEKFNINIIHANDSHYIYPEDSKYRNLYLKSKVRGKETGYLVESNFIMDYPSRDTIIERYREQGILSEEQIITAIDNTKIFLEKCEEITLYDKALKIPKQTENPNKELKEMLNEGWLKIRDTIPKERWGEYLEGIRYEMNTIEKTKMEEYFVLDKMIVERARKEYGCFVTNTGRGSAGSFLNNKILGLTGLDRLNSPVPLYPDRFMSVTRILETKSLPDIDIDSSGQDLLVEATKDIIGEENFGWLITYKPLQKSNAFKLLCKSLDYDFAEYNEVGKNIDDYVNDPKWGKIIKESEVFVGVIDAISPSPCSCLLSTKPVKEHIGYVRVGDVICCNLDGYNCDKYKYLKNDYLEVKILRIIKDTYELIGKPIPSIEELEKLIDDKTWDIYADGITCTINQVDSDYATPLIMRYKPKSVPELCAFIAGLRPSFASLFEGFINREYYTTNVKELDDLLADSFHYMLYQESIMKYLIWLGVEESESYSIMKKISKKKFTEQELKDLKQELLKGWIKNTGSADKFEETWQVMEDASKYSFNSSHSLAYTYNSLYVAYLKSHYPLQYYSVVLNLYQDDSKRTYKLIKELDYFGIKLEKAKFRHSKSEYAYDEKTNTIYKGMNSIKYMSNLVGDYLDSIKDIECSFLELIEIISEKLDRRKIEILISVGYFEEFGGSAYLLKYYRTYKKYFGKKQLSKDKLEIPLSIVQSCSKKETAKLFKEIDTLKLIELIMRDVPDEDLPPVTVARAELINTGSITPNQNVKKNVCIVSSLINKKTYTMTLTSLNNGETHTFKGKKSEIGELSEHDVIEINNIESKRKKMFKNGKWLYSNTETELWLTSLTKISDEWS